MCVRVVIADDHGVVRAGLVAILAGAGFDIVGQAAEGREALQLLRQCRPDVAVLDAALPGLSGIEVARRSLRRFSELRVVLVSMFDEPAWRSEASRVGASAYVLKGDGPSTLVEAVEAAASGRSLLPVSDHPRLPLTVREREVVQLVSEGMTLSQIASYLCRSPSTVRAHKASAMRKLAVTSTADLVRAALQHSIVCTPGMEERCLD